MQTHLKALLLLLLLPFSLCAQKDTLNKLDDKGKKQGWWVEYYSNGNKKIETHYVHGDKNGIERIYREDGKIFSEARYAGVMPKPNKSGKSRSLLLPPEKPEYKRSGREKRYSYDKDGNLAEVSYFKDETKDSISILYYPTGEIKAIGDFKLGKAHGHVKSYYTNGVVQSECNYKFGRKDSVQTYYYPNGEISYIGLMLNGKREGTHVYKHENGKIWQEIIFHNDLPWTVLTNYDPSGKAVEMGNLKDGTGTLYVYEENGTLKVIEEYKKGVKVK